MTIEDKKLIKTKQKKKIGFFEENRGYKSARKLIGVIAGLAGISLAIHTQMYSITHNITNIDDKLIWDLLEASMVLLGLGVIRNVAGGAVQNIMNVFSKSKQKTEEVNKDV